MIKIRLLIVNANEGFEIPINAPATADTATGAAGASAGASAGIGARLTYLQTMVAGAVSRSVAQTLMHPANTYKTLLQLKDVPPTTATSSAATSSAASAGARVRQVSSAVRKRASAVGAAAAAAGRRAGGAGARAAGAGGKGLIVVGGRRVTFGRLLAGVDAQFLLSLPHGAFHFFVIDQVKAKLARHVPASFDFLADFSSSAISTVICSLISTPQMLLTDRLMAGVYPSFPYALKSVYRSEGIRGFYTGWWPALAQKIPSYGLTWMFFQQLKKSFEDVLHRVPDSTENFVLGALAAAGSVTVMIPMDTVKTRLVIQNAVLVGQSNPDAYRGVADCFMRMLREEGAGVFYRSLPPRLLSVVPMIAIQFGVYETMKAYFLEQGVKARLSAANQAIKQNAAVKSVASTVGKVHYQHKQ
mmetsp:Transcript_10186/g.17037  ORF Transcript_10186/g.17037 Transcript_10186/m.17037 type:complete len:416 (+) Transcript_10186:254-1501(+)